MLRPRRGSALNTRRAGVRTQFRHIDRDEEDV
jgi:hypothetical protein